MPFGVGGSAENPQFEFLRWNYYPVFDPNPKHAISRNLGPVVGRFVNSVDTIAAAGISKTVLLQSSSNSRTISTPAMISLNENRNVPQDIKFDKSGIPVAVLLEGQFTSAFKNRPPPDQMLVDTLKNVDMPVLGSSKEDGKMIVVADGDMVLNDVSPTEGPLQMGKNFFAVNTPYQYSFSNRQFLLNCIEYLVDKPGIIETRNKEIVLRLLDSKKVKDNKTLWQVLNTVVPVFLVIIFGLFYQEIRKRKYAS
jgi:ABC-2 type transport system permease protein